LKKACCCMQVRTGALVIATLGVISSVYNVVNFIVVLGASGGPSEHFKHWCESLGFSNGQIEEIISEHEHTIVSAYWVSLAYQVGELAIEGLLLAGLAKRKHTFCLPWLILSALFLLVCTVAVVIIVIALWAIGLAGEGFLLLFLGGSFVGLSLYFFKVVQTEWMNIKDMDTPQVQAELGNRVPATTGPLTNNGPITNDVRFEPLPPYPGKPSF